MVSYHLPPCTQPGQAELEKGWILPQGCALALSVPASCKISTFVTRYFLIHSPSVIFFLRPDSVLPGRARRAPVSTARGTASLFSKPQPNPLQHLPWLLHPRPPLGVWLLASVQGVEHVQGRLCFFHFVFLCNVSAQIIHSSTHPCPLFPFFPFSNLISIIINFGEWLNCQGMSHTPRFHSFKSFGAPSVQVQPTDPLYRNHLSSLLNEVPGLHVLLIEHCLSLALFFNFHFPR